MTEPTKKFIPVNEPLISESDIEHVTRVLREGWISGDAPEVQTFEAEFAASHDCEFGVAVPNGTVALDLLFSSLELEPGDEVILPSFAIISCVAQLLRLGVNPVFVDSDLTTWNMDVSQIEPLITSRTRAILVVHTYGLPVDMGPLKKLSSRHNLPLIEDAAESHGLLYDGKKCGSFGLASTFSFFANKNVTTGEGGMICSNNQDLVNHLRYLRNLAFKPEKRFVHDDLAWNYRFTAIQAALGRSQLSRLSQTIEHRRAIASTYRDILGDLPGVHFAPQKTSHGYNDYWIVGLLVDAELYGPAEHVRESLAAEGVGTRPFFFPLHKQPVYERSVNHKDFHLPRSEYLYSQGLYLPNGLGTAKEDIVEAATRTRQVLGRLTS